jgi:hypothetical protein
MFRQCGPDSNSAAPQYFSMVKIWTFLELLLCSNHVLCKFESAHCGDGATEMTMQFVDGCLAAMLPSMFMVAWLVWRSDAESRDY